MKITNIIKSILPRRAAVLFDQFGQGVFGTWYAEHRNYSRMIWLNLCGMLFDIADDVKLEHDASQSGDKDKVYLFAAFKSFFYAWGRVVLQRIKNDGYVVIGWDGIRFWIMNANEYSTPSDNDKTIVKPHRDNVQAYVMKDATFVTAGISSLCLVRPWLDFLDDVCNGSATVSKRLGAVVIGSPKTYSGAPMPSVMTDEQKAQMEKDIEEHYGSLRSQHQFMLLPKEMAFQVVNLAGLDMKFESKLRQCVLAIADCIPIPANQVALVDANASKTLSNGGELREGDKAKYKSFRRLFERTFVQMAMDFGLRITYAIDGEPIDAEVNADGV